MQAEQPDLIQKWIRTGFLKGVKPQHLQRVAERLEAAMGQRCRQEDLNSLDNELKILTREGFFG